jgi:hypothetical protein
MVIPRSVLPDLEESAGFESHVEDAYTSAAED